MTSKAVTSKAVTSKAVTSFAARSKARLVDAALGLPPGKHAFTVRHNLAAPMPDGVSLMGDLYRPVGVGGPLPVVLIRLPYGKQGVFGVLFAETLTRRGFQVFIQATRGTFGSGGQFRPFSTEHEDGLATLSWVHDQTWCDGRVAMVGSSYFGHTQWAIAPYADPPLVCVSPHITAANITATFYEQGAPAILNSLSWTANIGRQEKRTLLGAIAPRPDRARKVDRALRQLPLQAADVDVAGAPVTFWRDFMEHAEPDDDFWSGSDHSGANLSGMPPVNMVTGWWDLFVKDQLKDFRHLRDAGVDARLTVGPWRHGEPAELKEMMRSDLEWLEHHLHEGAAPEGARVRLSLMPTDEWLEFDSWPPPGARPEAVALADLLSKRSDSSTFTYNPADPTPTIGGPLLSEPCGQKDNKSVEARQDVLVFTGPVLEADLDVVGDVRATIFVRTQLPHADLFIRLCDVDAHGVSRNVVDGIRRLTHRDPADSDGIREVAVDLFPTAYRFKAGHRLRIQIAGGAFPRFARNLGTGEPLASGVEVRSNRFEVLHSERYPSRLEISRLT